MVRIADFREMKMFHRSRPLLAVACTLATLTAAGCIQKLDSNASSGTTSATDPDGGIGAPFGVMLETPPIAKTTDKNGDPTSTAANGCEKSEFDSQAIRTLVCKGCHEGDGALGAPLTHILEDDQLINTMANQAAFPGWKYIVPGDPENSLVYHRAAVVQDMPRKGTDVTNANVALTISDMSVLRAWIMCLAPQGNGGVSTGAGGATGSPGTGGATGAGGMTGTGGRTGMGGTTGTGGRTGTGGTTTTTGAGGASAGNDAGAPGNDGGTGNTPCAGINNCNNPTPIASLPFSGMITSAQAQNGVCYETTRTVTAVDCTNANGRNVSVNGNQVTINNGTCVAGTVPAPRNGGFCVRVNTFGGGGGTQTMTLNISGT